MKGPKNTALRLVVLSLLATMAAACTSGGSPAVTPDVSKVPQATVPATSTQPAPAATAAGKPEPTTPPPAPTAQPAPTANPAPKPEPTKPPPAPAAQGKPFIEVDLVVGGLQTPWAIDFAPDGRIFVSERPGRIRIIRNGQLDPQPWITLEVAEVSEAGLLGLALDPQFSTNGFAYAAYTYRSQAGRLQNRLVRLREDPATGRGVADRVLLDGVAGGNNHDGGRVKFGPDGKLYWTMGETFNRQLAPDLSSLNGKILRINPDGTVPADNPFQNSPIFSYGHRNPQGLAWQPGTGLLYATEHGPSPSPPGRPSGEPAGCCRDEVNLIEAGKNYGWPAATGDETGEGMVPPILQSGDNNTWAPAGTTFVTRGPWAGSLLFTGLRSQSLFRLTLDPSDPRKVLAFEQLFEGQFGRLRDVVEGPEGAVYVLTSNRDGRGRPGPGDDRVLRLSVK